MSYIGNPIISTDFPKDTFSGNGSTTAFTMSIAPASVNAVIVVVSGITQDPSTYTISGTTLTFSAAPPTGTSNISVRHLGVAGIPNTPSAASVTSDKLATQTSIPFATSSLGAGDASIMKNRIINGDMRIAQRGSGATTPTTSGYYSCDRWRTSVSTASKFSIQQSSTAPTGFNNSLLITSLSAYTPSSSDEIALQYRIEGYNTFDLGWGTANAKTITISFWVNSSVTGTFGASLSNSSFNRWYPFSYTISSANTWEQKTITIAGDTTGTWDTTTSTGIQIEIGLGVGSTLQGTANAWTSSVFVVPTGSTNIVATSGATFYITGVQLEVGSSATGFEYRLYNQELSACQRYCWAILPAAPASLGITFVASNSSRTPLQMPVPMRTQPTASNGAFYATSGSAGTFAYATGGTNNGYGLSNESLLLYNSGSAWTVNIGVAVSGIFSAEL
jgi:hypothetical protein